MPLARCEIRLCLHSSSVLESWYSSICVIHSIAQRRCGCSPPFTLHSLPKKRSARMAWIKAIRESDPVTLGSLWQPGPGTRVCSDHLKDGMPVSDKAVDQAKRTRGNLISSKNGEAVVATDVKEVEVSEVGSTGILNVKLTHRRLEESDDNFSDALLFCGEEKKCIRAHRAVLVAYSGVFRHILNLHKYSKKSFIYLPDHEPEDILNLIRLMYCGTVTLLKQDAVALQELMDTLQINPAPESVSQSNVLTDEGFLPANMAVKILERVEYSPTMFSGRPSKKRKEGDVTSYGGDESEDTSLFWDLPSGGGFEVVPLGDPLESPSEISREGTPESPNLFSDIVSDSETGKEAPEMASGERKTYTLDSVSERGRKRRKLVKQESNPPPPTIHCEACGAEFTNKGKYELHALNHADTDLSLILCDHCSLKFKTREDRNAHEVAEHDTEVMKKCTDCDLKVYKRKLANHLSWHRSNQHFMCEICGKSVKKALKWKHMRQHLNQDDGHESNKPIACDVCGKEYLRAEALRTHKLMYHTANGFKCYRCKIVFDTDTALEEHKHTHKTKKAEETCVICRNLIPVAKYDDHLKDHAKSVVSNSLDVLSCPICQRKFPEQSQTVNHMLYHYDNERKFECNKCRHVSTTAEGVRIHQKIVHELQKVIRQMPPVKKTRISLPYVNRHTREKWRSRQKITEEEAADSGETGWMCSTCGMLFGSSEQCQNHITSNHAQ